MANRFFQINLILDKDQPYGEKRILWEVFFYIYFTAYDYELLQYIYIF